MYSALSAVDYLLLFNTLTELPVVTRTKFVSVLTVSRSLSKHQLGLIEVMLVIITSGHKEVSVVIRAIVFI